MKILFISNWFPYPPRNGAKIRIYNLIRQLSKQHEINLVSLAQTIPYKEAVSNIPYLQNYCRSINVIAKNTLNYTPISNFKGWFSLKPSSIYHTYSQELAETITDEISKNKFDIVIASEVNAPSQVSLHASRIRNIPVILDGLEFAREKDAYVRENDRLKRIRNGLTWSKLIIFTRNLINRVSACTVPSNQERSNLRDISRRSIPIEVIPHSLDLEYYSNDYGNHNPNTLVFMGSFTYHANFDAVKYFLDEIFPLVKKNAPDVIFKVIGSTDHELFNTLPQDNQVVFEGLINDVRPIVAQGCLSVVPLRIGSGTRLKIVESMALGTPVVSTSKGAEGLDVQDGENILIADTPEKFALSIIQIIKDHNLRKQLSISGRKLVARKYDSYLVAKEYSSFIGELLKSHKYLSGF